LTDEKFREIIPVALLAATLILMLSISSALALGQSSFEGGVSAPKEYTITFTESGLPQGTQWSITLNNEVTESSSGNSIVFYVNNGTYEFSISSVNGYSASPSSGSVTVNGENVTVPISFTAVTHSITFTETGLPQGTRWSVTLTITVTYRGESQTSSTTESSTTNKIVFNNLVNYQYGFTISSNGYTASPSSGSVSVSNNNPVVSISFKPIKYEVWFIGNSDACSWAITLINGSGKLYGTPKRLANGSYGLSFTLTNGNYSWGLIQMYSSKFCGYVDLPRSGVVRVNDSDASVHISEIPVNHVVTFIEFGLPQGMEWSVMLNGTTIDYNAFNSSNTNEVTFMLPEGTYKYWASAGNDYYAVNETGEVYVGGSLSNGYSLFETFNLVFKHAVMNVYSQYSGYFFTNFNELNKFYVNASYNGLMPVKVNGTMGTLILDFTYNKTIGLWQAAVNMGELQPGVHELVTYITYKAGSSMITLTRNYTVTVVQVPSFVIALSGKYSFTFQDAEVTSRVSFKNQGNSLYGNSFAIGLTVNVTWSPFDEDVSADYVGGNLNPMPIEFNLAVTLSSRGSMIINGTLSQSLNGSIASVKINENLAVSVSGSLGINYTDWTIKLNNIDVEIAASVSGSYIIPTPWGVDVNVAGSSISIGFTVTLTVGANANVNVYLTPTSNPSSELFSGIPLTVSEIEGSVNVPFTVIAALSGEYDGIGFSAGLSGTVTVGIGLQAGNNIVRGGNLTGVVNVFGTLNLVCFSETFTFNLLGPGVIYQWGNPDPVANTRGTSVSLPSRPSNICGFKPKPNPQKSDGGDPITWVNGSTLGLLVNGLPFGYGYSTASIGNLTYVYYTYTQDGVAWINGLTLNNTIATQAPLPNLRSLGVASPFTYVTNGSLMMLWDSVPVASNYTLSNLTILLQYSKLINGTWVKPVNVTNSGLALSYSTDGDYIYVIWSSSFNYSRTLILTYSIRSLKPVANYSIPGSYMIYGAWRGEIIVRLLNGSLILLRNGSIILLANVTDAGFNNGEFYVLFTNETLKLTGIINATIQLPSGIALVYPLVNDGRLIIAAASVNALFTYLWNGSLIKLRSTPVELVNSLEATASSDYLYTIASNTTKYFNESSLITLIQPLETGKPLIGINTTQSSVGISWVINSPGYYNVSSVTLSEFLNGSLIMRRSISYNGSLIIPINDSGVYTFTVIEHSPLGLGISTDNATYREVTFKASNLPSGEEWGVELDNVTRVSNTSEITFLLPSGLYEYFIQSPVNYTASPISGFINASVNVIVNVNLTNEAKASTTVTSVSTVTNTAVSITTVTSTSVATSTLVTTSVSTMTSTVISTLTLVRQAMGNKQFAVIAGSVIVIIVIVVLVLVHNRTDSIKNN